MMATPPPSSSSGLFSLPISLRLQIYTALLVLPHPLFIFQDGETSRPEAFAPDKPRRWLALLSASRQLRDEAGPVAYASNHFVFVDATPRQPALVRSFLAAVGPVNAGRLSHLTINFPVVQRTSSASSDGGSEVVLRDDGQTSLALLRESCPGLKTLEAQVHGENYRNLVAPEHQDAQLLEQGLLRINAHVTAMPSLEAVIVRIYQGDPAPGVVEAMRDLGWRVLRGDKDRWE